MSLLRAILTSALGKGGTPPVDPYEDFTTFTEVDVPANRIRNINAHDLDVMLLDLDETVYLYKSYGVGHFNGNFEHLVDIKLESWTENGQCYCWVISNSVNSWNGLANGSLGVQGRHVTFEDKWGIRIREQGGDTDEWAATPSTPLWRYLEIERDETGADVLICRVYSNAARTSLVDTLSITIALPINARYLYAVCSHNVPLTKRGLTVYIENMALQE